MKIGLFGGTFNPVHYGHLINAEIVKDTFSLNKVLFIPSKYPVHKNLDGNVSSEDRFNMLKLVMEDNSGFDVSRIEIDRKDESYFIFTLKQLQDIYKNKDLFLLIGSDAFNEIESWKESGEIMRTVSFIVLKRPGYEHVAPGIIKAAKDVRFVENPLIEISSSMIRENIRMNKSIKYFVPPKVEEYIISKELYKI